MHRRRFLGAAPTAVLLAQQASEALVQTPKKGVMLMNRIGPSSSELYIANGDGSGERKFLQNAVFDYHASFSPSGEWVTFTSERNGLGQSDIFRARLDGSRVEPIVTGASVDDAAAVSPDGSRLAFVSTRDGYRANIWIRELARGRMRNITGADGIQNETPNGFFRPSWSPDSQWLAFSSDRLTEWRGHDAPHGWEHTQELSIYVIRPNGRRLRRIASRSGYCLGSPKWSPDGRRIVFYEMTTEDTWGARRPNLVGSIASQIVSVDVATGERLVHTEGPGLKVFPQFIGASEIAYHRKGGPDEGVVYTSGRTGFSRALRSPTWSANGSYVIYEKVSFAPRPQNLPLYSWDAEWDYRYTDVFPALSRDGELVITEKADNSSIAIMNPDGSNRRRILEIASTDVDQTKARRGTAGAFQPAWSPDGQWIAFGLGEWFQERRTSRARIMRVRRDGTGLEALTDGAVHSGFPSYSAEGDQIVYRVWGAHERGLRILNLGDRTTRILTREDDNLPGWSPDGNRIVFTRRVDAVNFDIFVIRPDGSDLQRLTTHGSNDGHAAWTADGRIMWSSGMYGFRDEAALYDNTFQPYGQIFIMNADGGGKQILTDSLWEDAMPLYIPARGS